MFILLISKVKRVLSEPNTDNLTVLIIISEERDNVTRPNLPFIKLVAYILCYNLRWDRLSIPNISKEDKLRIVKVVYGVCIFDRFLLIHPFVCSP